MFFTSFKTVHLRLAALIAVLSILFVSTGSIASYADEDPPPDGFTSWDDYYYSLIFGTPSPNQDSDSHAQMKLVDENGIFAFYYNEANADISVTDKRSGKKWTSFIDSEVTDITGLSPSIASSLLEAAVVSENGAISVYSLIDASESSDFIIKPQYDDNKLSLAILIKDIGISMTMNLWISDEGFHCDVPIENLLETGDYRLLSLKILPSFGAARYGEDGFIFYPDGSGALIDIKDYELPSSDSWSIPVYGCNEQDIDLLLKHEEQGINNLMLPVFGIKNTNGGFLAAITGGEETAVLHLQAGKIYRAYFEFEYRAYASSEINFSGSAFGAQAVSMLIPGRVESTRTINYLLLEKEKDSYSDMAVAYRNMLENEGILKKQQDARLTLSVEIFMGVNKKSLFGQSLIPMTTFSQAQQMASELKNSGIDNMEILLSGWSKGGYETLPTFPGADKKLGGNSGLKGLASWCDKNITPLYAGMNFVYARKGFGKFNEKKDLIRDWLDRLITDKDNQYYLFNTSKTLSSHVENAVNKLDGNVSVLLQSAGTVVIPDYSRNRSADRLQTVNAYRQALKSLSSKRNYNAVSGGNAYILPYVDRIYDIPDTDSSYYQSSRSVPFYQMVMHGYKEYSSLAGNQSYNIQVQKLRWIETGSVPHFLLTWESPVKLKNTAYNKVFSSQYEYWKNTVIDVYKDMNGRLSGVWNQNIDSHEILAEDVVCLTYADGSRTYINYGLTEIQIENIKIPKQDYVVIKA